MKQDRLAPSAPLTRMTVINKSAGGECLSRWNTQRISNAMHTKGLHRQPAKKKQSERKTAKWYRHQQLLNFFRSFIFIANQARHIALQGVLLETRRSKLLMGPGWRNEWNAATKEIWWITHHEGRRQKEQEMGFVEEGRVSWNRLWETREQRTEEDLLDWINKEKSIKKWLEFLWD